jgi:hypothetical protein
VARVADGVPREPHEPPSSAFTHAD